MGDAVQQLVSQLNKDPAFVDAARFMRGEVVVVPGLTSDEAISLRVWGGHVTAGEGTSPTAIRLQAPDGWRRLATHGGLQRGFRHGYLILGGDALSGMRNWIALARLVDVLAREG